VNDRAVAPWLQAALGGSALLAVAEAAIRLQRAGAIGSLLHSPSLATTHAVALADRRVIAISRGGQAWLLVTGVLFMVWVGVAYRDLANSGARHRMSTPLAVLAPLIPLASLILMPQAMDDLARQGRFARTSRVGWWFAAFLMMGVLLTVGGALVGEGALVDYQRSDRVVALARITQVAAAALLIGLIGVVTGHAMARRREAATVAAAGLAADPEAGGGAIGWYRDPRRQAEVRWWDGMGWTVHVASTRDAPPPTVRAPLDPAIGGPGMPRTAQLCLFAGFLSIFLVTAPLVLGLGVWALRDLGRQPGAPGRGRAWFAVISGGLFTLLLALSVALG
jgi:hypothetical protein